jgi:hypothetical protein
LKVLDRTDTKEAKILADMIGNPTVLARIASKWREPLFKSPASNLIAKIAIEHYRKHADAPREGIGSLFEQYCEGKEDDETCNIANSLLGTLEIPNGECNPELALDIAANHFNKTKVSKLLDKCSEHYEANRIDKIQEMIADYVRVELGLGAGINVLEEESVMKSVFEQQEESLVTYPDDAGKFFQGMLSRDSFIAFEAPEKTGKTFWLLDVAWRAVLQHRKVAFFEVGDMSQHQILRRFYCRAAKHPFRSSTGKWPYVVRYPTAISRDSDGMAGVSYKDRSFVEPLTAQKSLEAIQNVLHGVIKSNTVPLKLACYPNSSIDIPGIRTVLDLWAMEGWHPDVVVIDYADILAPPPGKMEARDQINLAWKQMRALSQDKHCLVVTATQADADSYGKKTLDRKNFSEDKRKMSHVTGLVGINVFDDEKEKQVMRLNWIVLREGEYVTKNCLYCATCLPLANPCVKSCF